MLASISAPMLPTWSRGDGALFPFAPELVLICTIVANLLTPFFVTRNSNFACALVSFVGVALAAVFSLVIGGASHTCFHGLLLSDPVSIFWKMLLLIFVLGILLMWLGTTASRMHAGDGPEFFTLLLGATLGMCLMVSTSNLLMMVIAMEMASLPSYVLAGFRKTHRVGAEASLKYVLFGAASSGIMVYGLSFLYGLLGTLQLEEIAAGLARGGVNGIGGSALLTIAIAGLIVGIGFKISAVPFHFWCPDVFEGAGIDVSAFLSVASKGAALVLMLRVFSMLAYGLGYHDVPGVSLSAIAVAIGILGAVTATVGNTGAFVQSNIKRLLAYSSIAQAGYILCAISLLVRRHDAPADLNLTTTAAQAVMVYLAVYVFMNLGAFTCAALIYRETASENIADYAGMGRRSPVLAVVFTIFLLSLIGLPPLAGFDAKLNVMLALGWAGGGYWVLVAVIGINTVLSLYYYLRIVKIMYFGSGSGQTPAATKTFIPNPIGLAISVICAFMLLAMFFGYAVLSGICTSHDGMFLAAPATIPTPTATADAK
jgi:NADH-quinone oxidoreductase subunit N